MKFWEILFLVGFWYQLWLLSYLILPGVLFACCCLLVSPNCAFLAYAFATIITGHTSKPSIIMIYPPLILTFEYKPLSVSIPSGRGLFYLDSCFQLPCFHLDPVLCLCAVLDLISNYCWHYYYPLSVLSWVKNCPIIFISCCHHLFKSWNAAINFFLGRISLFVSIIDDLLFCFT